MSKFDGEQLTLAKVYSDSMLTLAEERNEAEALGAELADLAAYVAGDAELATFLSSPTVDVTVRAATLEKLLRGRYSDLLIDALQVLNRNERLGLLGAVAETYHATHEDRKGNVEVYITTATPLSDAARSRLRDMFSSKTGKRAELVETVDESLIGVMVARLGDEKLDTSVSRKLIVMADRLLDRASREIHSGRTYVVGSAE